MRNNAKKLLIIYLALPLLSFAVSTLLYALVFSVFDANPPANMLTHYLLILGLTYAVYFVSTLPALLIRILAKRPIKKRALLLLVSTLLASVGASCCMLFVNTHFENTGTSMIGIGLFIFLGTYLLLGLKGADGDEENGEGEPTWSAATEPATETARRSSFFASLRKARGDKKDAAQQTFQTQQTQQAESQQPEADPLWYIHLDGQNLGPYTREEMVRRARRGTIVADTLVWDASSGAGWVTAREARLV